MVNKEALITKYNELVNTLQRNQHSSTSEFEKYVRKSFDVLTSANTSDPSGINQIQESIRAICRHADDFDFGNDRQLINNILEDLFGLSRQLSQ